MYHSGCKHYEMMVCTCNYLPFSKSYKTAYYLLTVPPRILICSSEFNFMLKHELLTGMCCTVPNVQQRLFVTHSASAIGGKTHLTNWRNGHIYFPNINSLSLPHTTTTPTLRECYVMSTLCCTVTAYIPYRYNTISSHTEKEGGERDPS